MTDVKIIKWDTPYRPNLDVEKKRGSALNLIAQLLNLQGVMDKHLTEQLSIGLWKWTEADGIAPYPKYNLRFVSEGVLAAQSPASIQHEHVWPRRHLIKTLRSRSWTTEELQQYLSTRGLACVVTVDEHARLSGSRRDGWERYVDARVRVWDRGRQEWLKLGREVADRAEDAADNRPGGGVSESLVAEQSGPTVKELIAQKASPRIAERLQMLTTMARFATAVPAASYHETGEVAPYFRIHDALIPEPTAAVAYVHWTGKVAFRLDPDDLPAPFRQDSRAKYLANKRCKVSCTISDDSTLDIAEELLFIALEKLRSGYGLG